MKRISLFLILMAFIQANPVHAQRLGDGRFLRRMFGVEEPISPQAYQRQSAEAAEAALKQQQALKQEALLKQQEALKQKAAYQQRLDGQRLPAPSAAQQRLNASRYSPPSKHTPTLARPSTQPNQRPTNFGYRPFDEGTQKYGRQHPNQTPPAQELSKRAKKQAESLFKKQAKDAEKLAAPKKSGKLKGFGLDLRMKDKQAVVTRVEKSSTASEAGIKQGDLIKSIGSLPIESINDAEQFAEVLKPGDQLEFEVVRRGKESKLLVSFIRVAEENQPIDPDELAAAEESESADDEINFFKAPTTNVSAREPRSILSRPGAKNEVEELREVVQLQKEIINGLQKRLTALEQGGDAVPTLNFPR